MSVLETYAPDRIGYRYGVPDSAYAKGYHRGQDVRQVGPGGGSIVTEVDAIDAGRVVYVGRPNKLLQLTVVIDTGRKRGRYESHSHVADVIVSAGDVVESGQRLGRNAEMWESPGQVDGVHDHITITDYPDGAWTTSRPEYDPLPFIQAAYARAAQAAGDSSRPFTPSEEDDMTPEQAKQLAELHQVVVAGTPENPSIATVVALTYQTLGVVRQVLMAEGDPFKGIAVVDAENHAMLEKVIASLPKQA